MMKSIFVFLFSLCSVGLIQSQIWTWSNSTPKAGEAVNVDVKDIDTKGNIYFVSYSFNGKDIVTTDVNYTADNAGLHVTLPIPSETNWIRLVVKDEDGQALSGDQKAVVKPGAPAQSSQIEQALAASLYYRFMGLKRDEVNTASLFEAATQANPDWLDNPDVLNAYCKMAKAAKSETDLQKIKTHLQMIDAQKNSVSTDLLVGAVRTSLVMGDTLLAKSLRKKLDKIDPHSILNQEDQLAKFSKATSAEDKIAIRNQFKSTYTITDQNRDIYDKMTSALVEKFATMEDWNKVESYINEIVNPLYKAQVCNNYAWTLAGEGIDKEASRLDVASSLSLTSLHCLTPDLKKPNTTSPNEWKKNLENIRAQYGDTYALTLYKEGKYTNAVEYQAHAVKTSKFEDVEMNERYVIYLQKAGQKEELLSFVDDMIEMGKASAKMKEIHKQIWTTEKTPDQLYDQYVTKLEEKAKEKRLEEIQAMWMDAPAGNFTLKNLKGEDVSLSDYKGKTVIIDFWATWCGPCKASFPGMKQVVDHYADNKDVVFLFVDTWETGENIPGRVSSFIKDNNYPFPVVLDGKNEVVGNYKVDGIPTKFIIDKDQRIRFKSVGYGGDTDGLVEEVITMIEMAQNGGKLQKS